MAPPQKDGTKWNQRFQKSDNTPTNISLPLIVLCSIWICLDSHSNFHPSREGPVTVISRYLKRWRWTLTNEPIIHVLTRDKKKTLAANLSVNTSTLKMDQNCGKAMQISVNYKWSNGKILKKPHAIPYRHHFSFRNPSRAISTSRHYFILQCPLEVAVKAATEPPVSEVLAPGIHVFHLLLCIKMRRDELSWGFNTTSSIS